MSIRNLCSKTSVLTRLIELQDIGLEELLLLVFYGCFLAILFADRPFEGMKVYESKRILKLSEPYLLHAECPVAIVDKIRKFWNGKPPKNVLRTNVGTVTYVWLTRSFLKKQLDDGLLCFATNLNSDLTTSTDILVYENRTPVAEEITYFQSENDGVITLHSHGEPDDSQYILYQKDHVSTFWQCKKSSIDEYDPFVGISVSMMYTETAEAENAIQEGKKILNDLELNTGSPMTPCTEDHINV